MKRILISVLVAGFFTVAGHAQESATQQQIDQLNGRIQDLIEGQARQGKQLDALSREISEMREKVNAPAPNDFASREELKRLSVTVEKIESNRQADKELILKNIEALGKAGGEVSLPPRPKKKKTEEPKTDPKTDEPTADGSPQNGYEYKVRAGDSLGLIVKAYRDKGVKVTTTQILKANPGLDPDKLFAGRKIFIPEAAAK